MLISLFKVISEPANAAPNTIRMTDIDKDVEGTDLNITSSPIITASVVDLLRTLYMGTSRYLSAVTPLTTYIHQEMVNGRIWLWQTKMWKSVTELGSATQVNASYVNERLWAF